MSIITDYNWKYHSLVVKINRFLTGILAFVIVVSIGTPAFAQVVPPNLDQPSYDPLIFDPATTTGDNPLTTSFTYSGNVDVAVSAIPNTGSGTHSGTHTILLPAGSSVTQALLYTNSWFVAGSASGTFDGNALPAIAPHASDANSPSSYRWDVTSLVPGSGSYPFSLTSPGQIYHTTLVVVYTNAVNPTQTIIINDGSEGLQNSMSTTNFDGVDAGSGRLIVVTQADNALGESDGEFLNFNGATLLGPTGVYDANLGDFATMHDVAVTTIDGTNSAEVVTGNDFFGWHLAILVFTPEIIVDGVVGGELLGIDNMALLLAGLQTSTIWMLPVLAGAASAGAFFIKTRMNKD